MTASHAQIEIGSVVTGTVRSLQPYGAFIDIGGVHGLLHINEISYDRISDVGTVLQPGDTLKVKLPFICPWKLSAFFGGENKETNYLNLSSEQR